MTHSGKTTKGLGNSVWDERQRQAYQRVNSRAYNLAWGLLIVAFLVQVILFPTQPERWLVEMGLFLLINLYTLTAYLREGLWTSQRQQPSARQNLLASLAAGVLVPAVDLIMMALSDKAFTWPAIRFLLLLGLAVFVLAYGALALLGHYHRKKQREAEQALDADA